jgi:hypothetical protein
VAAAALCTVLAGCAATNSDVPNTGLLALTAPGAHGAIVPKSDPTPAKPDPGDITALASRAAIDLQNVIDSGALNRPHKPGTPANARPAADLPAADLPAQDEYLFPPAPPEEALAAPVAQEGPQDPLLDLAQQMAALLRDTKDGKPAIPDAVALAPIEAMQPGVLAEIESSKNALGVKLSPEDRRALAHARDRILAQPGAANETLARTLARLSPPPTLKIGRAVLCTRVLGFGRYDPINTNTFIARRPIRAILYIELDGFATRPARAGDNLDPTVSLSEQVSVELSQSLTLFQDPSGLQAWYRPARTVVDTSRNKRRDFYLIQQFELPDTLTIGKYNLKATVKDITSGSEADVALPINIVADSSALTSLK